MASELTLDAATHTYRLRGKVIPGVTEVLDQISELDGIPRAVLAAAAEFGTHVHLACHLHDMQQLDRAALDPRLEPYVSAWDLFLRESKATILTTERMTYHPGLHYATTIDREVVFPDSQLPHVLEIKTSANVPRTVGPQTAAQRECNIHHGKDCSIVRYVCHLQGNGKYQLSRLINRADFSVFVSCLNLWRFRNGK